MTTATTQNATEKYLEAVRQGLSDLPEEDVAEVLQDLATHLSETGNVDPVTSLGSPEDFVSEFRSSAGLDRNAHGTGTIRRRLGTLPAKSKQIGRHIARRLEPVTSPLIRRRAELRTAWIWSRGIVLLSAYWWTANAWPYGTQHWVLGDSSWSRVLELVVATTVSVWLAGERGKWSRRGDTLLTLAVAGLVVLAIVSPRYIPGPEDFSYTIEAEPTSPVLLIGPNGPIQNLYAYDIAGNPVQILLYDEYGNPIHTLPPSAYEEAELMAGHGEPFIWEGFELRFVSDIYGRPIGNLYPLDRYEWGDTGARSAPQPPPVVGIPEVSQTQEVAPVTGPSPADGGSTTETTTSGGSTEVPGY